MKPDTLKRFALIASSMLLGLAFIFLTCPHCNAQAQSIHKAAAFADKLITLDLYDVSMTEALTACCKQAGCRYHISDAMRWYVAHERRTLHVRAVPFKTVFHTIVGSGAMFESAYSYHKCGDIFYIAGPTVFFNKKQAKPADVLKSILADVDVNYIFPTEAFHAAPMNFVAGNIPLEQALNLFLSRVRLPKPVKYAVTNGVFVFFYTPPVQGEHSQSPGLNFEANNPAGLVTVSLHNVEYLVGLRVLFQTQGIDYFINVPWQGKLSLNKEAHYKLILDEIMHSANNSNTSPEFTYKVENRIFTFIRRFADKAEE